MPNSNIDETKYQVKELLGVDENEILAISAKSGEGVKKYFLKNYWKNTFSFKTKHK